MPSSSIPVPSAPPPSPGCLSCALNLNGLAKSWLQADGAAILEDLVSREGYRAVRFNPYLWPDGERMTNDAGRAMYAKAGELGVPVGVMTFKGLLRHIDEITELATDLPKTVMLIDHFGFCSASDPKSDEWRALLALARCRRGSRHILSI